MKDLGREARELLEAAGYADAAPTAIRLRSRKRFLGAVAAGTVTTSAVLGKGAWLASTATGIGTGAGVSTGTSLTATLVSAVVIGLSTGLVAVSPASRVPEAAHVIARSVSTRAVVAPLSTPRPLAVAAAVPSNGAAEIGPVEGSPLSQAESQTEDHAAAALPIEPRQLDSRSVVPPRSSSPNGSGPASEVTTTAEQTPTAQASSAVVASPQTIKTSIARETELLAEAQRALGSGRPMLALVALDRYDEECPHKRLYEEAVASRVVALCAVGRIAEGRRWGLSFLRQFPNSPLSTRVRSACSSAATSSVNQRLPSP